MTEHHLFASSLVGPTTDYSHSQEDHYVTRASKKHDRVVENTPKTRMDFFLQTWWVKKKTADFFFGDEILEKFPWENSCHPSFLLRFMDLVVF